MHSGVNMSGRGVSPAFWAAQVLGSSASRPSPHTAHSSTDLTGNNAPVKSGKLAEQGGVSPIMRGLGCSIGTVLRVIGLHPQSLRLLSH